MRCLRISSIAALRVVAHVAAHCGATQAVWGDCKHCNVQRRQGLAGLNQRSKHVDVWGGPPPPNVSALTKPYEESSLWGVVQPIQERDSGPAVAPCGRPWLGSPSPGLVRGRAASSPNALRGLLTGGLKCNTRTSPASQPRLHHPRLRILHLVHRLSTGAEHEPVGPALAEELVDQRVLLRRRAIEVSGRPNRCPTSWRCSIATRISAPSRASHSRRGRACTG